MQKTRRVARLAICVFAVTALLPLTGCSADSSADLTACKKLAGYWNDGFSDSATSDQAHDAQRNIRSLGENTPTELGTHITKVVQAWESDGGVPEDVDLQAIQSICSDLGIDNVMGF